MKVDIKSEFVQWMLRTWVSRLANITFTIMAIYALVSDKSKVWPLDPNGYLDIPAQRYEMFLKSCNLDSSFEFIEFWMEFFSQKKMEVLCQEALDDTHLPFYIENEVAKDKWLRWLAALDLSDTKNGVMLAMKCYFAGESLALIGLGAIEEMEFQSLQNTEAVCFALVAKSSVFTNKYTTDFLKTISAKHSAFHKTKQVDADRETIKVLFEKWGQKNCSAFRAEAMLSTGKTDRTVQNRLKEFLEGQ